MTDDKPEMAIYNVLVDECVIKEVEIEKYMLQRDRDVLRREIANDLGVPMTYVYLRLKRQGT